MGDRKISVPHLRVRAADGSEEIPLDTYHRFQDPMLATQAVRERMLYGLVSRRFVQATQLVLDRFLQRRLHYRTWVVVMIDGLCGADHLVVGVFRD